MPNNNKIVTVLDRLNTIEIAAKNMMYGSSSTTHTYSQCEKIVCEVHDIMSVLYGGIQCEDCNRPTNEPQYTINGAKTVCVECYKSYVKCKGCGGDVFGSYVNHKGLCSDCA